MKVELTADEVRELLLEAYRPLETYFGRFAQLTTSDATKELRAAFGAGAALVREAHEIAAETHRGYGYQDPVGVDPILASDLLWLLTHGIPAIAAVEDDGSFSAAAGATHYTVQSIYRQALAASAPEVAHV